MLNKSLYLLIVLFALSSAAASQIAEKDEKNELQTQAVDYLKETSNEINILRTPENRIGFNAELAALMWLHDETQARTMFGNVISDFRQMLVQIDSQINAQNFNEEDSTRYMPFLRADNSKAKLLQKLRKAMNVRQQIAAAIAENDAILAYEFFTETANAISNQKIREQYLAQDAYFEQRLLEKVAEQNPDKLLEFARKSLKNGVNESTFSLLKKIYEKNDKEGAAFGQEVLSKIKELEDGKIGKVYFFSMALDLGGRYAENSDKTPLFTSQTLRETADLLGSELIKMDNSHFVENSSFIPKIEKYSPGRAAQVRQKYSLKETNEGIATATAVRIASKTGVAYGDPNGGAQTPSDKLEETFDNLGKKPLSAEDKEKFLAQIRGQIAKTENPTVKITMLGMSAAQMSKMGEQELAVQLMKEAESFGTQYPVNYLDFMQNWMLAGGYAQIAPEKAFPILEDTIYRLNETVSAFVKVGEFMDVNGEIVENGEIQVGSFGGGMTKDLIRSLGETNGTLRKLAENDFARTKNLANRFERTELRILARMLILRAIFSDQNADKESVKSGVKFSS